MSQPQEMQVEVEKLKAQCEEYLSGWKRAKADLVNFQKQVERERTEWFAYANAAGVKAMLPVLDSLEAATNQIVISTEAKRSGEISHGTDRHGVGSLDYARDDSAGIAKIRDQMAETLRVIGVESIKSVGEPVNPEFHEVVSMESSEVHAPGIIVKEAQRGYMMHGKILRAAKVIVSE